MIRNDPDPPVPSDPPRRRIASGSGRGRSRVGCIRIKPWETGRVERLIPGMRGREGGAFGPGSTHGCLREGGKTFWTPHNACVIPEVGSGVISTGIQRPHQSGLSAITGGNTGFVEKGGYSGITAWRFWGPPGGISLPTCWQSEDIGGSIRFSVAGGCNCEEPAES